MYHRMLRSVVSAGLPTMRPHTASRFVHILGGEEVRREQQKREAVVAHKQPGVEAPVT